MCREHAAHFSTTGSGSSWAGRTRTVSRWRGSPRALVVLASLAIVLALVAAYARQTVVELGPVRQPSHRGAPRRQRPSLIAEKITDEVVLKNQADLVAARPIIESVASDDRRRPRVHGACSARRCATSTARCSSATGTPSRSRSPTSGTVLAAALQQVRPDARRRAPVDRARGGACERHRQPQRDARRHRRAGSAARAAVLVILALALVARRAVASRRTGAQTVDRARHRARRGRRRARGGVLDHALDRGRPRPDGPDEQAAARRGLGRLPRRPSHRGLDPRRLRARWWRRPRRP